MNDTVETDCRKSAPLLRVFVYGTLQKGQSNHGRCCAGVVSVEDAWTSGRLYDLPWGFPALQVEESSVLARGTRDAVTDWQTQCCTQVAEVGNVPVVQRVFGQLLGFDDPKTVLGRLDFLEGFRPGAESLYERVLVSVDTCDGSRAAWLYVMTNLPPGARRLPAGRWPDGGQPRG